MPDWGLSGMVFGQFRDKMLPALHAAQIHDFHVADRRMGHSELFTVFGSAENAGLYGWNALVLVTVQVEKCRHFSLGNSAAVLFPSTI